MTWHTLVCQGSSVPQNRLQAKSRDLSEKVANSETL
jgi:hypothetical protein